MTTTPTHSPDPVLGSVAAYSDHLEAYTTCNADLVADQVNRFLGDIPAGGVILDAGCGPGRDLDRFVKAGYTALGVDLNPDFVNAAAAYAPTVLADLRDLPFEDHSFDGVWACASLVHLDEPDARTALAEIARVLVPGGRGYISIKHAGHTGWTDTPHGRRYFEIWKPETFLAAVTDAGLNVLSHDLNPVFLDVWTTRP